MIQTATVKRMLTSHTAEVAVKRQSACGHDCAQCGGCVYPELLVVANNPIHAVPGQSVLLKSSSRKILTLAVLVYLIPVILFFVLYFSTGHLIGESGAILSGVAGFVLALFGICIPLDRKMRAVRFEITAVEYR